MARKFDRVCQANFCFAVRTSITQAQLPLDKSSKETSRWKESFIKQIRWQIEFLDGVSNKLE